MLELRNRRYSYKRSQNFTSINVISDCIDIQVIRPLSSNFRSTTDEIFLVVNFRCT